VISIFFLVVEIVSFIVGVSITRTITGAVHSIYEGTERVREGDFSHRIAVRGSDQLSELAVSFNRMTEDLERLFVVEKEKERLQSELEIAREVQNQLFPKHVPVVRNLELAGVCNPARMVSGDYYDFLALDHSLAVAIGDVAGKGISAALLMAAIQSTMRTQLTAGVAVSAASAGNGCAQTQFSTARIVSQLNKQLYANTAPEKYATFWFGMYDDASGVLRYTNAGHLQPIVLRNGAKELLEVTGTVVGAFPFAQYEERAVALRAGDLLIAYTDGIAEPENEFGEQFGEERVAELVAKFAGADASEIIARVMERVREWSGGGELQDDMTMIVLRRI
jgi:sigma-B regulation protein RsbU (phosphoserine phosphatase)